MSKTNGNGVAMMIGGLVAGVVGSRLIPPLLATVSGAGRVRAGGDPFALLIDDHRKIKQILNDMVAAPPDSKIKRGKLFLMLKRKLGKHALAEENVVYPIVYKRQDGQSKQLYDEHADMKILLYEIESKLMNNADWSNEVRVLRELISNHIDEEENTIFPQLRAYLSRVGQPRTSGMISREEALIV